MLQSAPTRLPPSSFYCMPSSFLSEWMYAVDVFSHATQRQCSGALFVQQTHRCPLEKGDPAARSFGSPLIISGPITEETLAQRAPSKHAANGTFICLPSHPLPHQPSFTGIHSAFSSSPMATAGLVKKSKTFSWCHDVMWLAICWTLMKRY